MKQTAAECAQMTGSAAGAEAVVETLSERLASVSSSIDGVAKQELDLASGSQ